MMPASTKQAGMSLMMAPDVCFIPLPMPPAGPGGAPIPFGNQGMHMQATKTTKKVFICKKEVLIDGSEIPRSSLDEPGCSMNPIPGQKGVVSRKNMEKVVFKKASATVKFEGKGVITLTAPTMHNKNNTAGMHSVPSQTTVFVGG